MKKAGQLLIVFMMYSNAIAGDSVEGKVNTPYVANNYSEVIEGVMNHWSREVDTCSIRQEVIFMSDLNDRVKDENCLECHILRDETNKQNEHIQFEESGRIVYAWRTKELFDKNRAPVDPESIRVTLLVVQKIK